MILITQFLQSFDKFFDFMNRVCCAFDAFMYKDIKSIGIKGFLVLCSFLNTQLSLCPRVLELLFEQKHSKHTILLFNRLLTEDLTFNILIKKLY